MTVPFKTDRIHHVAYRCKDAKETVDWYARVLGFNYTTAFAEDHVPSTGEYDPYMHIFLECGGGNVLAFFELPNQPEMGRDEKTPAWVQHLAFKVADFDTLKAAKAHIEALGIDVIGQIGGALALGGAVVATLLIRPWEPRPKVKVSLSPSLGGAVFSGSF